MKKQYYKLQFTEKGKKLFDAISIILENDDDFQEKYTTKFTDEECINQPLATAQKLNAVTLLIDMNLYIDNAYCENKFSTFKEFAENIIKHGEYDDLRFTSFVIFKIYEAILNDLVETANY